VARIAKVSNEEAQGHPWATHAERCLLIQLSAASEQLWHVSFFLSMEWSCAADWSDRPWRRHYVEPQVSYRRLSLLQICFKVATNSCSVYSTYVES
jgi:hypothetical protein